MRPALALLFLSLFACWPQLRSEEWRANEAAQLQIAAEMVQNGDWMVPTFRGEATLDPPLVHWVLAGLIGVSRDPVLLRLPSVLGFWLLAVVAYRALRRRSSRLAATVAAVGITASPFVLDHIPYAEIDPLFAALTGISIVWLSEGAVFGGRRRLVLAGIFGGLAILAHGASYSVFLAGSCLVWMRRLRLAGFVWFALPVLVVPLLYYMPLMLWHVGPGELVDAASRKATGLLSGWTWQTVVETPWYFVCAFFALMPLGLWTFHEYRGDREMREAVLGRDEAFLRMSAGAMVSAVLLIALLPDRPGRYLLPGVPCYLLALGPAIAAYMRFGAAPSLLLGRVVRVFAIVASVGFVLTPWLPFPYDQRTPVFLLGLALAPLVVRIRRDLAVYALFMPLVAAWTVMPDRASHRALAHRSERIAGQALAREIARLGAADLAMRGAVPPGVVLELPSIPPADPQMRRPPTSRWLLVPASDLAELSATYAERVRVQLTTRSFVLMERR